MSMRKKLITSELNPINDNIVKRRSKVRRNGGRSKNKRRNTIAGTDGKEIKQAIIEKSTGKTDDVDDDNNMTIISKSTTASARCTRSISTDILQEREIEFTKWNFDALKAWGRSRLRSMRRQSSDIDKNVKINSNFIVNTDEINNHDDKDLVNKAKCELEGSQHERKPSLSSTSTSGNSVVTSNIALSSGIIHTFDRRPRQQSQSQQQQQQQNNNNNNNQYDVRLRERAAQRRERRKGNNNRDDPLHSSSGNWSASSESGRTSSIGSETASSNLPGRSSNISKLFSQNHGRRLKGRDTPTSSSVTSEASTLTPDIIQDIIPFHGDDCETEGETCSVYSCDTEGYYTSFHMDSGLKTLREEELAAAAIIINGSISANNSSNNTLKSTDINLNQMSLSNPNAIVENEYELFGRGSTSTTTSSAGTVCTTLMAAAPPAPPERKSSLTVVAMVKI